MREEALYQVYVPLTFTICRPTASVSNVTINYDSSRQQFWFSYGNKLQVTRLTAT